MDGVEKGELSPCDVELTVKQSGGWMIMRKLASIQCDTFCAIYKKKIGKYLLNGKIDSLTSSTIRFNRDDVEVLLTSTTAGLRVSRNKNFLSLD